MNSSPLRIPNSITCLVLSFNKPDITTRCLKSCLDHFPAENIFLIHNGSLPQHRGQLQQAFPQVHHLFLETNHGYSGGAQSGFTEVISRTDSEFIFFITNDCQLLEFPRHLKPDPLTLAGGTLLRKDLSIEGTWGVVNLATGRLRHQKKEASLQRHERHYIPGHFFLISKKVWEKLGGFNTTLHTYWEDVDLSLRAQDEGIKLTLMPEIKVQHAGGKTTRGNVFYSLYLFQRNRKRVVRQHTTAPWKFQIYFYRDLLRLFWISLKTKKIQNAVYFWKILRDQ